MQENPSGEDITVSNTNTAREHVEQKQFPTVFFMLTLQISMVCLKYSLRVCQGEKQHAHTSYLHPKTEALSEQRQNTGLQSQEGSMASVLLLRPSHMLPDLPPPELGRNGACVNVYGPNKENTSSMGTVIGVSKVWIPRVFLAHSSFFQSTSTMLSTPLVSSFNRTRLCCCCMACRNLDNC